MALVRPQPRGKAIWLILTTCSPCLLSGLGEAAEARHLELNVLSIYPHDPQAFTQGLLIDQDPGGTPRLFESTGLYGLSTLREVNLFTGEALRSVALSASHFGEGLALVGDRLIQLTWRENVAHIYDRDTFQKTGEFAYAGEGWGLCFDGTRLIMSDGSARLYFRSPETFEVLSSMEVTLDSRPQELLNELEFAGGYVYANVWMQDTILQIDPRDGDVVAIIDASGLLSLEEEGQANVLNGIAYDEKSETFLITGKLWPAVFEVTFDMPRVEFLRGDCNDDGAVDISDATCILNWVFAGEEAPGCDASTNTNGDEVANVSDATYLLNHLFAGGPAPVAPFPDCGPGALPEELSCENPSCQ